VKNFLVSWWFRELMFSRCELLLLEACTWGQGTVRESRERGTSVVGSRYQKTGENTAGWEELRACCSELQNVWISNSAVTICKWSINRVTNPNTSYSHPYTWHYKDTQINHKIFFSRTQTERRHASNVKTCFYQAVQRKDSTTSAGRINCIFV
jgi:hypothetical protein